MIKTDKRGGCFIQESTGGSGGWGWCLLVFIDHTQLEQGLEHVEPVQKINELLIVHPDSAFVAKLSLTRTESEANEVEKQQMLLQCSRGFEGVFKALLCRASQQTSHFHLEV